MSIKLKAGDSGFRKAPGKVTESESRGNLVRIPTRLWHGYKKTRGSILGQ